jgi:V8-like Glu-specific endopeptidase
MVLWLTRGLVLLAFSGCSYDPAELAPDELETLAQPIVNGVKDPGHPAVGMLTVKGSGNCTATLVGTHTVLTAAHCVVEEKTPPFTLRPKIGWSPDGGGTIINATSVVYHPDYTGISSQNYDVAVVLLSKKAAVKPRLVATKPPVKGEKITLVGYGITSDDAGDFGTKRKAQNTIGKVTATEIVFYGATGNVGNICNGDSGGPTFAQRDGEEVLVGVHSWGEDDCGVAEHDARADVYHGWIKQQSQGNLYEVAPKDTKPPEVQILSPSAQAQVAPSFQVEVSAQDDTALDRVELFLDGALHHSLQQEPFSFSMSSLEAGSHNLRAEAVDKAGHRSATLVTVTVVDQGDDTSDPVPPAPAPTAPPGVPPPPAADPQPPDAWPQHNEMVGGCSWSYGTRPALPLLLLLLGLLSLYRIKNAAGSLCLRGRPRPSSDR